MDKYLEEACSISRLLPAAPSTGGGQETRPGPWGPCPLSPSPGRHRSPSVHPQPEVQVAVTDVGEVVYGNSVRRRLLEEEELDPVCIRIHDPEGVGLLHGLVMRHRDGEPVQKRRRDDRRLVCRVIEPAL